MCERTFVTTKIQNGPATWRNFVKMGAPENYRVLTPCDELLLTPL